MNKYEVSFINGHTGRFEVVSVEAANKDDAVDKVFGMVGHAFENRLVSVK